MSRRRRLRTSQPIPELDDAADQPTVPLNIVSADDWRSESEVKAVNIRTSWGKVLATRDRATTSLGSPLRFFPASVAEITQLWYRLGGAVHPLAHNPLVLVRISQSGLAPLILLSLAALTAMEDDVRIADRLRIAIDVAVAWVQNRESAAQPPSTCMILYDSGGPLPVAATLRDPYQMTPPPFHIIEPPPGCSLERKEKERRRGEG